MTEHETSHDPLEARARRQREGVARSQVLLHSGLLDVATALVLLVGLAFLPDVYDEASSAARDVLQVVLGVGAGALAVRGGLRMIVYLP